LEWQVIFGLRRYYLLYSLAQSSHGVFWVQDIDLWRMELYAGYRYYDYDRKDFDTSPIHVPLIGTYKTF
jgi:hypothetical protein